MKKNIDNYINAIVRDNEETINNGGYTSVADYIINSAESAGNWYEYFDDSELEEPACEPLEEQIEELKNYLNDNWDELPDGWDLRRSVSGEYWQVYHDGITVYADSADEDLYDRDSALAVLYSVRRGEL